MDRTTHARFLTYLESFEYFREPGQDRLDRESWLGLDSELERLLAAQRERTLTAEEQRTLRALAKVLLRD